VIPEPNREAELVDGVLDWLQTNVLKLIFTRVIPAIMASGVMLAVLAWLQDAIGLDLDPAIVATWVGVVMAGVITTLFAYVRNHGGAAHIGATLLELLKLREAAGVGLPPGLEEAAPVDPTQPPGLSPR
jgi:hypothetical protein